MSAVRFTAALVGAAAPTEVPIPASTLTAAGALSIVDGGLFTLAPRNAPRRAVLLWISDLSGEQIGVVS